MVSVELMRRSKTGLERKIGVVKEKKVSEKMTVRVRLSKRWSE